jgi:large conductance mechanosensitive channel
VLKEFKAFILRGNVVDLAVGIVIGAAFGAIVNSLVKDVVSPVLTLVHLPDFSRAVVELGPKGPKGNISYGLVINAVISFLAIGLVVFFFVVKPVNALMGDDAKKDEPSMKECPHCLSSIPAKASVCSFCTREVRARRASSRRR